MALAALIHLPMRLVAAATIAIISQHNLLDPMSARRFRRAAWIWDILQGWSYCCFCTRRAFALRG